MKLPIKQILSKNRKHYQIVDRDNKIIIADIELISDAFNIEDAVNNYPKCLELLNEAFDQLKSWKKEDEEDSFTMKKINEFLNKF